LLLYCAFTTPKSVLVSKRILGEREREKKKLSKESVLLLRDEQVVRESRKFQFLGETLWLL